MTEGKTYCVYIHTNLSNGKKYCGITSQKPEFRWRNGDGYKYNLHFMRAIEKYGWDGFSHTIVDSGKTLKEANELETFYIKKFNLTDPAYGYNQTNGGDGISGFLHTNETKCRMSKSRTGHLTSFETREKISASNKGSNNGMFGKIPWNKGVSISQETRSKISLSRAGKASGVNHPMYGKHHKEESIRKMSNSHKGATPWNKGVSTGIVPPNTRGVSMYDMQNNHIRNFSSIAEAARFVGGSRGNISKCCKKKYTHAYGYIWRYCDE